jgi:small-conductance mechanosensitive channel
VRSPSRRSSGSGAGEAGVADRPRALPGCPCLSHRAGPGRASRCRRAGLCDRDDHEAAAVSAGRAERRIGLVRPPSRGLFITVKSSGWHPRMNRQTPISISLILATAALGVATYLTDDDLVAKLFLTALVATVSYLVFSVVVDMIIVRRIQDMKTRYTAKKVVSILSILLVIVLGLRIWVIDPAALLVTYGIIGAGIAFALQDVFKNVVGGILIMVSGYYRVGERISIDDKFGDVMDIGILGTTLMEIRGWVRGDQPSGRLLTIPNGLVLNHSFLNYTRDHSFIWDEISLPLTYESDWRRAREIILSILRTETDEMTEQAEIEIERIGQKYYLPRKVVEPSVYVELTDNWITLDVRYVTDARNRRILRSRLSELILSAIEREESITIASETMTVTSIRKTAPSQQNR